MVESAIKVVLVPVSPVGALPISSTGVTGGRARTVAIDLAVAANLNLEPLRKRVDGRNADSVQSGSHLVAAAAEFASGMEDSHHHFQGIHRLTAALFCVGCGPIGIPRPLSRTVTELSGLRTISIRSQAPASASSTELSTTSCTRWWQTPDVGRADVHAWTPAHGFQPLQDLDVSNFVTGR